MIAVFFLLWIVLCGRVTLESVAFGIAMTAVAFWFVCRFCRWSLLKERNLIKMLWLWILYALLLVKEILVANVVMLKLMMRPDFKKTAQPKLVQIHVPFRTNIARMTLANSITLTPGTLTVEAQGNDFTIHCFRPEFGEGLDESSFVKALLRMDEAAALEWGEH